MSDGSAYLTEPSSLFVAPHSANTFRSNPTTAEYLVYQNESTVENSNFTYGLPIRVIAHGWNNDGSSTVNTMLTEGKLAFYYFDNKENLQLGYGNGNLLTGFW